MKRKTVMMMGAVAALTAGPALAQPATAPAEPAVPAASSYADLLQPIPNAVERLKIADMQDDPAPAAGLIKAQYYGQAHHHHHHRRRHIRRHHHHHNSYPPQY